MDPFSTSTKLRHLDPDTPYTLFVWALTSKGQGAVLYIEERTIEATGTLLPLALLLKRICGVSFISMR